MSMYCWISSCDNGRKETSVEDWNWILFSLDAIQQYIDQFKPFDKAGSYGIQEWIGAIGINRIEGSYNNVVGLPTHEVYQALKKFQ